MFELLPGVRRTKSTESKKFQCINGFQLGEVGARPSATMPVLSAGGSSSNVSIDGGNTAFGSRHTPQVDALHAASENNPSELRGGSPRGNHIVHDGDAAKAGETGGGGEGAAYVEMASADALGSVSV